MPEPIAPQLRDMEDDRPIDWYVFGVYLAYSFNHGDILEFTFASSSNGPKGLSRYRPNGTIER